MQLNRDDTQDSISIHETDPKTDAVRLVLRVSAISAALRVCQPTVSLECLLLQITVCMLGLGTNIKWNLLCGRPLAAKVTAGLAESNCSLSSDM